MMDESRVRLERAKEHYTRALAQIDVTLKALIAVDPSLLREAKAFQQDFTAVEYTHLNLKALQQPISGRDEATKPAPRVPQPRGGRRT